MQQYSCFAWAAAATATRFSISAAHAVLADHTCDDAAACVAACRMIHDCTPNGIHLYAFVQAAYSMQHVLLANEWHFCISDQGIG